MAHFQRETGSASLETGTGYHETIGSPDSEIGCLPFRVRFRLARNGHALKSQRGFRPVAGKTQELLSLLFGPSPIGPSKAISCVCVIFIDSGHGASLPSAGARLVSQPSISAERGPGAMVAAPCAYSPSIARRTRHPAKGQSPPGRRRKKLVHRLILIEAKPAKRMSAGQERC